MAPDEIVPDNTAAPSPVSVISENVDVSVPSLIRLLIAFVLSTFFLAMLVGSIGVDIEGLIDAENGLGMLYLFVPFMGLAAAIHLISAITGDKSILMKKVCRYPVRILTVVVLLVPPIIFFTGVANGSITGEASLAVFFYVMYVICVLGFSFAYLLLFTNSRCSWPKAISIDSNPLGEVLVLFLLTEFFLSDTMFYLSALLFLIALLVPIIWAIFHRRTIYVRVVN